MFLKRVLVSHKRTYVIPLNRRKGEEWIQRIAQRAILSVADCISPQQRAPMGCKQSTISGYRELTEEDVLAIPLLFRDMANRNKTPGMRYWFDTCAIREGTMPLQMGVGGGFVPLGVGNHAHGGVCVRFEVRVLSRRAYTHGARFVYALRIQIRP